MNNAPDYMADKSSDEIDLFELLKGLMEQKALIAFTTVMAVVLAAFYVFWATPTYKSTAYFLPPTVEDVQEMNSLNLLVDKAFYSQEKVYGDFLENLASRETRLDIFKKFNLASRSIDPYQGIEQQALFNAEFNVFSKAIKINFPSIKAKTGEVSVDLQLKLSPEKTAEILNALVALAKEKTAKQYYKNIQAELKIRQQRIEDQISSLRKIEQDRRLDQVVKLQEASTIARSLELSEPMATGPEVKVQGVMSQGLPLYYLGYKLLNAELNALRHREDDDPFIEGLRGLQQKLSELESLTVDLNKFGVVTIDQSALPAVSPIKPKKALILIAGAAVGLALGVFIALIRRSINKRKASVE